MPMALDGRTAQEQLTPEARRGLLRAFADRMLIKAAGMDDPEDMPGVERCVRVAAVIERIYSRCDRAELHAPDLRKVEAERAHNEREAIKARVALAGTLAWSETRRRDLGPWWDAAAAKAEGPVQTVMPAKVPSPTPAPKAPETIAVPEKPAPVPPDLETSARAKASDTPRVSYTDYNEMIEVARAELAAQKKAAAGKKKPPPP